MNSDFLYNLEKCLHSETVPQNIIDKVIEPYKNYVHEAQLRGESEDQIIAALGNPVNIATDLRQKLNIKPKTVVQNSINNENEKVKEKRSLGAIFGSLLLVFIVNLFAVPITLTGFLLLFALLLLPITAITVGISLIFYNAIYINGFKLVLSLLTSISLGIGIIGVSIFLIIGVYYLIKYFGMLTALFYSYQAKFIRRYK